jgi:hypothetical protein
MQGGIAATLFSITMLAAFALAVGGIRLIGRGAERQKGTLMLVMALVLLANVLIWTL